MYNDETRVIAILREKFAPVARETIPSRVPGVSRVFVLSIANRRNAAPAGRGTAVSTADAVGFLLPVHERVAYLRAVTSRDRRSANV